MAIARNSYLSKHGQQKRLTLQVVLLLPQSHATVPLMPLPGLYSGDVRGPAVCCPLPPDDQGHGQDHAHAHLPLRLRAPG